MDLSKFFGRRASENPKPDHQLGSPPPAQSQQPSVSTIGPELTPKELECLLIDAKWALEKATLGGFTLTTEIADLAELDALANAFYTPEGIKLNAANILALLKPPDESVRFLYGLSYHLGLIAQKYSGGVWCCRGSIADISVETKQFQFRPMREFQTLLAGLNGVAERTSLTQFELQFTILELAQRVRRHEITTAQQLIEIFESVRPKQRKQGSDGLTAEEAVLFVSLHSETTLV